MVEDELPERALFDESVPAIVASRFKSWDIEDEAKRR